VAARVSDHYRTAFITGASTGLGRAFTEMLLREGVKVWGTSRDLARLGDFAKNHPADFKPVALELRDGRKIVEIFSAAEREAGGFDIVVNNAGYGVFAEFAATDFAVWEQQFELMLIQPARLSHAALRGMLARNRGALVNIASLAGEFPMPFQSGYNAVKAALIALNESLMVEVAQTEVAVIDFRPGDYRTDFDGSILRPNATPSPRMARAWAAFEAMMRSGPEPSHAADALRRALLQRKSGTVRTGRFFQAVVAPFITRFGSLPLRRRIQARYFDVS
jgi:short-subunit dehydrogenase